MKKFLHTCLSLSACILLGSTMIINGANAAENSVVKENLEKLLKTKSCKGCNLSGLTLSRLDLSGADLEGADLSSSKLSLTNLSKANLRNSDLRGVVFGGSDLSEADLRGADLRGTSLDTAYHQGAQFDGKFVTDKPYKDFGVSDVEKKVFVPDSKSPKQPPETKAATVDEEVKSKKSLTPPSVVAGGADSAPPEKQPSSKEDKVLPKGSAPSDAPSAKKIVPLQQAVIDSPVEEEKVKAAKPDSVEQTAPDVSAKTEQKTTASKTAAADMDTKAKEEKKAISPLQYAKKTQPIKAAEVASSAPQKEEEAKDDVKDANTVKAGNLARLLDKNGCVGCDLSGLDLSGKDLEGADLEKANLTGSNLENADLAKANLKGALLQKAILRKANLKKADLYKADLTDADLTDAKVAEAMFDSAETASAVGFKEAIKAAGK